MQEMLRIILPVFLVVGFGYVLAIRQYFTEIHVDAVMRFASHFAVPVMLFRAISILDLSANFDAGLLGSFYFGAVACFLVGLFGARFLFGRDWEDAVVIAFCCLFSNAILLGLPITERAFGAAALSGNFAIISLHALVSFGLGITVIEFVRARKNKSGKILTPVLIGVFKNALIVGITLGFAVNLTGMAVPAPIDEATEIIASAAIPVALFGMGGALSRYKPQGDARVIAFICLISLVLHPTLVWCASQVVNLDQSAMRSALITSSMAPGINGYMFASLYNKSRRVAASSVLVGTFTSLFTAWFWLGVL